MPIHVTNEKVILCVTSDICSGLARIEKEGEYMVNHVLNEKLDRSSRDNVHSAISTYVRGLHLFLHD